MANRPDARVVCTGDVLSFGGWMMGETRLGREPGDCIIELPPAQSVQKIASEDDPLSLPSGEPLLDEMIDTPLHRIAYLGAESTAAEIVFAVSSEELAVSFSWVTICA
jgi:hypothetical protein